MEQLEFTATADEAGVRIDRCLSDKYEELSRSYLTEASEGSGRYRQWESSKSKLQNTGRGSGTDNPA